MRQKLPDFPWDALAPFGAIARNHPEGVIDLSVGTPVDATPEFIQQTLQEFSNSPGYPLTAGTSQLRSAIDQWARKTLGATGDFGVLPIIGSKEFVAWLPSLIEAKQVLYPKIAYPTYLVGALLAQAQATAVDIDASTWPIAELAWINSPANPTGRVHSESELAAAINWAKSNDAILVSDECYLEFGDSKVPTSILKISNGDNKNILAVFSLSKRSSMAGYRAAFIVGDPDLITRILEVRKHAGMMVPLPIQAAMVSALSDSDHVAEQRARYNKRRSLLAPALQRAGFTIEYSEAGLYIWATRQESAWESVQWLAELGILATPGIFYGEAGQSHIRIALTATDEQIATAVERISAQVGRDVVNQDEKDR
uniref:succinyldiaminopimelate transaminase n=1 Tax=Candidatus Planktophila sp. TaxID=2175601 RepID=UPI004049E98A